MSDFERIKNLVDDEFSNLYPSSADIAYESFFREYLEYKFKGFTEDEKHYVCGKINEIIGENYTSGESPINYAFVTIRILIRLESILDKIKGGK